MSGAHGAAAIPRDPVLGRVVLPNAGKRCCKDGARFPVGKIPTHADRLRSGVSTTASAPNETSIIPIGYANQGTRSCRSDLGVI